MRNPQQPVYVTVSMLMLVLCCFGEGKT